MLTVGQAGVVEISSVKPNPVALRQVEKDKADYLSLRDSIADVGVLSSISVRVKTDEAGNTYYEVIDGLHRYTAALEAGVQTIPVLVKEASDQQVLAMQIQANIQHIETKPMEFTQQMQRMFAADPSLTVADMALLVRKTPKWVEDRLGLLNIAPALQLLVNDGKIKLINAYALKKLPEDEQLTYAEAAMVQDSNEFGNSVEARVKQLREDKRKGRDSSPAEFVPQIHVRKLAELKAEAFNPSQAAGILAAANVSDPVTAFQIGVQWTIGQDPQSLAVAKAAFDQKKADTENARKKASAERAQKKLEEAAKATLAAKVEAGIATATEVAEHETNVAAAKAAKAEAAAKKAATAAA